MKLISRAALWRSVCRIPVNDSATLIQTLDRMVQQADFSQTSCTQWSYLKVATFLEDGWTSAQNYIQLRNDVEVDVDHLGQVINRVAGGHRYEQQVAEDAGLPWLGEGAWPTRSDLAAFVYFLTCTS